MNSSVQYNLTPPPKICCKTFRNFSCFFSYFPFFYCFFFFPFYYFYFLLRAWRLRHCACSHFRVLPQYVCVCVCVPPANVTVMLTGVAHGSHSPAPAIATATAPATAPALPGKSAASAAKLLHQHFVCIRGSSSSTCVCPECVYLCVPVCVTCLCYTIICVNIYSARFSFNIKSGTVSKAA